MDTSCAGEGVVDVMQMSPTTQVAYLKTRLDQHVRKEKSKEGGLSGSNYVEIRKILERKHINVAKAELRDELKDNNGTISEVMATTLPSFGNMEDRPHKKEEEHSNIPTISPYDLYQKAAPMIKLKKSASTRDEMARSSRTARQKWARIGSAPPSEVVKSCSGTIAADVQHLKQKVALLKNQVLGVSQTPEVRGLHKNLEDMNSRMQNQQVVIKGLSQKVGGEDLSAHRFKFSQVVNRPCRNEAPRSGRFALVFVVVEGAERAAKTGGVSAVLHDVLYHLQDAAVEYYAYCAVAREDASLWSFDSPERALCWCIACSRVVSTTGPGVPLRLRFGLQVGTVEQTVDPFSGALWYHGATYNTAAALAYSCPGGCIAMSPEAFAVVKNEVQKDAFDVATYEDGYLVTAIAFKVFLPARCALIESSEIPSPLSTREPAGMPLGWRPEGALSWPPSGEVTVLCCMVDNYPRILRDLPDDAPGALEMCFNDVRRNMKEYGGYESRVEGHLMVVVFQSARDALDCAFHVQNGLNHSEWPDAVLAHPAARCIMAGPAVVLRGLRVALGLHSCATEVLRDALSFRHQYFGPEVSLALAATTVGIGGEIIATEATTLLLQADGVESSAKMGCPTFTAARPVQLPDGTDPVKCFEVSNTVLAHRRAYFGRGFHRGTSYVYFFFFWLPLGDSWQYPKKNPTEATTAVLKCKSWNVVYDS